MNRIAISPLSFGTRGTLGFYLRAEAARAAGEMPQHDRLPFSADHRQRRFEAATVGPFSHRSSHSGSPEREVTYKMVRTCPAESRAYHNPGSDVSPERGGPMGK